MENDVIEILSYAALILPLIVVNLYMVARGLPIIADVYEAFWGTVGRFVAPLRRLFDPGTPLAKSLRAKGVNPLIADAVAEMAADFIEDMARPYVKETIDES